VNLVLVPLSEIPLMLGMASIACGMSDWLATPASWLNGLAGAWLHAMTWIADQAAQVPGISLHAQTRGAHAGPMGAAMIVVVFLAQCEAKSLWRLLGIPAGCLLAWMASACRWTS
jgi:hypothetical protein